MFYLAHLSQKRSLNGIHIIGKLKQPHTSKPFILFLLTRYASTAFITSLLLKNNAEYEKGILLEDSGYINSL